MEIIKLHKKISLNPQYLNCNIKEHLYDKLKKLLKNQCTKENGYVASIYPDIKIIGNELVRHGYTRYDIEFTMETLKPLKGQIWDGTVCLIFDGGIFLEVQGKMKVLIPVDKLGVPHTYDKSCAIFRLKTSTISEKDIIKVELNLIRYSNKNFNCIGSLIT